MYKLISHGGSKLYDLSKFYCDSEDDVENLPRLEECSVGSIAVVPSSGIFYYLNGEGEWLPCSTSGGSGPVPTGTLEITANGVYNVKDYASAVVNIGSTTANVYGVTWDGTETTRWMRTDLAADFPDPVPYIAGASSVSSPFDNLMPWRGMTVSVREGGVMVAIPKFWYKLEQIENDGISIKIADAPEEGFAPSPAHMDRGDGAGERDVVYVGRYHCVSDYKSTTGALPKTNINRPTARSAIHDLGPNIWQCDFAMRFTIWLLYLVEFADWNSQAKIGHGCGNGASSRVRNMGYTDSMPYHTGTTQSDRTTYGFGTQYRNIEGLWDNVLDWMDGGYNNSSGLNLILNPSNFSDSSGGTLVGLPSNGYPTKFTVTSNGGFQMFYPSASGGSGSTYSCDSWGFSASAPCLCAGGSYGKYTSFGLFCVACYAASETLSTNGCRIMELP